MTLLYRQTNGGKYAVVDVPTPLAARDYAPYQAMPTRGDAEALANHLNGHDRWPKKDCTVCQPDTRAPEAKQDEEKLSNGELTSRAIAAAEARLREMAKR